MNILSKALVRISMVVLLATSSVSTTTAQELSPDHLALALEYVQLTDKNQIYERSLIETGIETMRTIVSQNPEITDEVSDSIGVVIEDYSTQKDTLFNQFARVYALRFTQAELTAIVEFYKTDVGRKLSSENAAANNDLRNVMRVFQSNLNTEFLAKVRAELRKKDIEI